MSIYVREPVNDSSDDEYSRPRDRVRRRSSFLSDRSTGTLAERPPLTKRKRRSMNRESLLNEYNNQHTGDKYLRKDEAGKTDLDETPKRAEHATALKRYYPSKASVARKQMRLRRSIYHSDDASDLDLRKRESRKRSRDPRTRSTDSRKISRGARRRSRAPQRSRDPHSTDEEILIEEPGRRQEPGEIVETRRKARQSNEEYGLKSVLLTPVTDLSLEDLRLELTSRSLEKEAQEESDKKRYMRRRKIHDECAWIYEEIVRKTAQMDAHKKIEEERERLRDEIRAEFEETRRKEVEDAHHKSLQEAEEREKPNRGVREGLREESRAQFGEKDGGKSKGEYGTSTYSEEGLHARQLHYASHPTYSPIARIKALANNFYNTWFSRPPEYGKTRIAWQCPCGQRIHDDYVELERGALKSLQRELNGFSRKLSSPGFRSHSNGRHEANVSTYRGSDGTPQQEEPKHTSSPKDAGDTSDMDLESGPAGNVAEASKKDMSRAQPMHLVLGHPNLYLATRLRQPDTSDYSSDLEFFQSLRDHYYAFRGIAFRRVFSLRSLAQVRFVRFEMFKGGIAEIRKLDDIPPDELCQRENKSQHGDAYTYQPRPAPTIPPLGSATIQHLMQHFDTVDKAETNIFERFPRKLFDELKPDPQSGFRTGWGLQFVDHVSPARVFLLGLICALISTAFGIAWVIAKRDIQGGFTVATFLLTSLLFVVGGLHTWLDGP